MTEQTILGCDISLNHGAFVALRGDEIVCQKFYCNKKKWAKTHPGGLYLDLDAFKKDKDRKTFELTRLCLLSDLFGAWIGALSPSFAGVEDYAYSGRSGSLYQSGEVGGAIRLNLWKHKVPVRFWDPGSLKLWTAHTGKAEKHEIAAAVSSRWGVSWSPEVDPEGDLADAYALARLVQFEVRIRSGQTTLNGLHPKEIEVLNRTTKSYPVNVLARPFAASSPVVVPGPLFCSFCRKPGHTQDNCQMCGCYGVGCTNCCGGG